MPSAPISEMIPEQPPPSSAADAIFAKLPSAIHQQLVDDFCTANNLGLEDGLVILLMRGASPGAYFVEQLPGEAEQQKLQDYCSMENLSPEAAILSLINRALEQPQVLEEARKSPFVAQAQQQLGSHLAPAFQVRAEKACTECGAPFRPRNVGQVCCEKPACWASHAGLTTDAQRNAQMAAPTGEMATEQRFARLEGMFAQLMQKMEPQQQQRRA